MTENEENEIIKTSGVKVNFGDFWALKGIDITVKKGEIIDSGNHEQLIQNSEEYKSLYKNQLK